MAAKTPCVIAHMTVVPENYNPEDFEEESAADDREDDVEERRRVSLDA